MPRLDINPSLIGYLGNNGLSQFGKAAMQYADDSAANNRINAKIKLEEDAQKSMNEFRGAQIKLQEGELANQNARTQIMRDELTMKSNAPAPAPKLHGVKFDNNGNAIGVFTDGSKANLGFKGKEPDGGGLANYEDRLLTRIQATEDAKNRAEKKAELSKSFSGLSDRMVDIMIGASGARSSKPINPNAPIKLH